MLSLMHWLKITHVKGKQWENVPKPGMVTEELGMLVTLKPAPRLAGSLGDRSVG